MTWTQKHKHFEPGWTSPLVVKLANKRVEPRSRRASDRAESHTRLGLDTSYIMPSKC